MIEWRLDLASPPLTRNTHGAVLTSASESVPCPVTWGGRFWHDANAGQPDIDYLDWTVRKHMAVFCLVERLEGGKHLRNSGAVQGAAGEGDAQPYPCPT